MELRLDLHTHSAASADGRMSVEEIVAEARKKGLGGAARRRYFMSLKS